MNLCVAIDACCLGRRKTGNETYIRGLLHGFELLRDPNLQLEVITTSSNTAPRAKSFDWREIPTGNFFSRNFRTIPRLLNDSKAQLFHGVYWSRFWDKFPKVLTIHDISFISFPEGYKAHERLLYRTLVREAAVKAKHIITVSQFSKHEICRCWNIPDEKVSVTYQGLDECFYPETPSRFDEVRLDQQPYILYVGNLHPRKNLVRLLQAFVLLKKEQKIRATLKIVGQKAWLFEEIFEAVRDNKLESDVEFTGFVDQETLVQLYRDATVLVYPSLYEGFGFPVLEAMGCGTPVITSNITSLPEVAGSACELIDPRSVEEIARAISRVFYSQTRQAEMRRLGLQQAQTFSWKSTACETVKLYRQITGKM